MPNMSYCRFQNTYQDLLDCRDHIGDEDLSREEFSARDRLIKVCQEILEEAEDVGLIESDNGDDSDDSY